MLEARNICRDCIRCGSIVCDCNRIASRGDTVERRPVFVNLRNPNIPIIGALLSLLREYMPIGQNALPLFFVVNRFGVLATVRLEWVEVTRLNVHQNNSGDGAWRRIRRLLRESRRRRKREGNAGE